MKLFISTTTNGIGSIVFARNTSAVGCTTAGTTLNSPQLNVTDLKFYCVTTDGTNVTDVANTSTDDTATIQKSCNEIDMVLSAKPISGTVYENTITHTYVQQIFIRSGAAKTS